MGHYIRFLRLYNRNKHIFVINVLKKRFLPNFGRGGGGGWWCCSPFSPPPLDTPLHTCYLYHLPRIVWVGSLLLSIGSLNWAIILCSTKLLWGDGQKKEKRQTLIKTLHKARTSYGLLFQNSSCSSWLFSVVLYVQAKLIIL